MVFYRKSWLTPVLEGSHNLLHQNHLVRKEGPCYGGFQALPSATRSLSRGWARNLHVTDTPH